MKLPAIPLIEKAVQAVNAADWILAESLLERIRQRWPKDPRVSMVAAMVARYHGEQDTALDALDRARQFGYEPLFLLLDVYGTICLEKGRNEQALECFQQAIRLSPSWYVPHFHQGCVLMRMERYAEAHRALSMALGLESRDTELVLTLAVVERILGFCAQSLRRLQSIRALHPEPLRVAQEIVKVATDLQAWELAQEEAEAILAMDPSQGVALSSLLFVSNFKNMDRKIRLEQTRKLVAGFSSRIRQAGCPSRKDPEFNPEPALLDVGIVSGDLGRHPVGYFLQSFLPFLSRPGIRLHVFSTLERHDQVSDQIRQRADFWDEIGALSDQQAAALIARRSLHLLFDLSGHTSGNRLGVFALQPAPLQVSWLGYFATTGLAEMDYVLVDEWVSPCDEHDEFIERRWFMPDSYRCFRPMEDTWPVQQAPCTSNGFLTYGCFNNLSKINDQVLSVWARILERQPDARILLKARQLGSAEGRQDFMRRFNQFGVDSKRVQLEGHSSIAQYMQSYARVDIALDPFPYTGATVSLEGMWMGVPVLTLHGSNMLGRSGVQLLGCLDMNEWIASDEDDYVLRAVSWASRMKDLEQIRAGLRQRLTDSALFRGDAFAADWEAACRGMWRAYCERSKR